MNASLVPLFLSAGLLSSCGSRDAAGLPADVDPATTAAATGNPFFPLEPGTQWSFVGEADGLPYTEEIVVLEPVVWPERLALVHTGVFPVEERRYVGGVLVEVTSEWFTTDLGGDVYQVGEQSFLRRGDSFVEGPDSWFAGKGDVGPIPYLPAKPAVGMRIVNVLPHAVEVVEVADVGVVIETPAGVFRDCIELHEDPEGADQDIVLYSPGTGIVAETSSNGYRVLTKVRRR